MITREKLHYLKKLLREDRYDVSAEASQVLHTLVDSNLEALTLLDGGMDAKERERQISLALADLRDEVERLSAIAQDSMHPEWGARTLFTLDMVNQMVNAKGVAWRRKWDWYTPRIAEEFGQ